MHINLNIQPETAERLEKVLAATANQEAFAQNIIAYQIEELQKGVINIRLDLKQFEKKYQQSTEDFYQQYQNGYADDDEEAMLWAGLYEMLKDNESQLQELL